MEWRTVRKGWGEKELDGQSQVESLLGPRPLRADSLAWFRGSGLRCSWTGGQAHVGPRDMMTGPCTWLWGCWEAQEGIRQQI